MSTIVKGTVTSNTVNSRYGYQFDSIYNTMLKPQVYADYVKYYGKGIGLLEFAYLTGATTNIKGNILTLWAEGSLTKLVKLHGAINPVAMGNNITFSLDAAEFDANGNCYLNLNDVIVIPAFYMQDTATQSIMPHQYQVVSHDGGAGNARIYTATPKLATSTLAIAVPDDTELMVTGGNYALESAGGKVKSSGWLSATFKNSIKKHDWAIGGGTQSNERYYEELRGGGTGILTKNTMEADYWLDKYINDEVWLSQGVTNNGVGALQQNNRDAVAIPVTGTVGVLKHLVDSGMKQYYTAAYQMSDFDDIKSLLESQGIMERSLAFFMGSNLYQQIENSGLDFIKEFSGGTDFARTLSEIKVAFRAINKNGVYTVFKELPSLSDPMAYGAEAFDDYFKDLGFILPDVEVSVTKDLQEPSGAKIKNLTLGFKNYNGENRTRIVKDIPSMASQGSIAVDNFDDSRGSLLSEFCVIFPKPNQAILVLNDNIL